MLGFDAASHEIGSVGEDAGEGSRCSLDWRLILVAVVVRTEATAIQYVSGEIVRLEALPIVQRFLDAAGEGRAGGHAHLVPIRHHLALRQELLQVAAAQLL